MNKAKPCESEECERYRNRRETMWVSFGCVTGTVVTVVMLCGVWWHAGIWRNLVLDDLHKNHIECKYEGN